MPNIDHLVRTDHRAVDKNDELRRVLGWLQGDVDQPPIITDDERPVGLVNDRSLMRRRLDWKSKITNHFTPVKAVTPKTDMHEVVKRMMEARSAYVPVEDDRGKTKGYVRALDVAREMPQDVNAGQLAVQVTTLRPDQTLSEALNIFAKEYVDFLPIVEADGRLRSVLSRRTMVSVESARGRDPGRKDAGGEPLDPLQGAVEGFSESNTVMIKPSASHADVLDQLQQFDYVIVVDEQSHFQGIITAETLFENSFPRVGGS